MSDRDEILRHALAALVKRAGGEATVFDTEMEMTEGETLVASQNDDGSLTLTIVPDYVRHSLNTPPEPFKVPDGSGGKYVIDFNGKKLDVDWTADPIYGSVGGSIVPNGMVDDISKTYFKNAIQPYQKLLIDRVTARLVDDVKKKTGA